MARPKLLIPAAIVFCTGLALPAQSARSQGLPEGTFASDIESCAALETKTPAELGEELDFQVLNNKGLIAHQQSCDFVTVAPHKSGLWVATAICDELGYTYPDLFSIKQKDEGRLNVTRLTDLNQQDGEVPAEGSDGPRPHSDNAEQSSQEIDPDVDLEQPLGGEQPPEAYSTFVKCPDVKP